MNIIYKALADKNRLMILTLIKDNEGITVSKLKELLNSISQPTLSSHLAVLKRSGLVEWQVDGRWRKYFVKEKSIEILIGELRKFIGNGNMAEIELRRC